MTRQNKRGSQDLMLRVCPDEEDTIDQIVNLLVDTCSSKRRMLRVAGDDKPAEVVRSRFMKLNADHIRFVLKWSCGKYRTGPEHEAVSAGCTLQCTHDHAALLPEPNQS